MLLVHLPCCKLLSHIIDYVLMHCSEFVCQEAMGVKTGIYHVQCSLSIKVTQQVFFTVVQNVIIDGYKFANWYNGSLTSFFILHFFLLSCQHFSCFGYLKIKVRVYILLPYGNAQLDIIYTHIVIDLTTFDIGGQ